MEARWLAAQRRLHAAVKDSSGNRKEIFARRREAQLAALPRKGFHGGGPSSAGLSLCGGRDGLLRAKAFASNFAGDDGGGAFGRRSPRWRRHLGAPSLLQGSLGENPIQFGRATAAPPASSPPWRRRLLRPNSAFGIIGDHSSWMTAFGGGAGWLCAGWRASWGCQAHVEAIATLVLAKRHLIVVGLLACSKLRRLTLLRNCQCSVVLHRRTTLAAMAAIDDLACSRQRQVAQLC